MTLSFVAMKTLVFVVAIALTLALGAWFVSERGRTNETGMKNVEMLRTGDGMSITVEPDVEYYPGAKGYFVRPEGDATYPGIVMIHENRGLRPEIRSMADELAKDGYIVLAVDLLGGVVETQEEARALTAGYDQARGIENMRAAAAYLRSHGASRVASLGWCFGGAQSLALALSGEPLDATVIYYGRLVTETDALRPISWPVLGIFGGADQSIPVESVDRFKASLDMLGVKNEMHVYPGVGHAFANPSGTNYAPEETKDAWAKTLRFLDENLK